MEQPDTYYLNVIIENFEVISPDAAKYLFHLLEESAFEVSKLTDYDPDQIWPIYKVQA